MKAPIALLALLALLLASCGGGGSAGGSPSYPRLSGRVVDTANLLDPAQEAALTSKLEALQRASSRQLVVATIPDLQGRSIEEYGVGLGRFWRIGQGAANNGTLLIVAVAEKKIRIEIGYGLEGILTDALSSRIIRERITPRFQANDYAGGIIAGTDAIIAQLQAPREAAERNVAEASRAPNGEGRRAGGGSLFGLIIWGAVLLFVLLGLLGRGLFGRRYGRRVSIWGPGDRGGGSGIGWMLVGMALGSLGGRGGRGGGWGGGGSSGGGGGFSGGGGSFGGGGASGGW
ncbi:MAG TPA: TPM domain-containing protein [Allosphingosinicella sp.]|nr:TPM domain-containing protein [Allosphingosinicella sp.]